MIHAVKARLTPATAIALLALVVSLGGTSYAALRVSSKQIVDNSVRSKDVKNNDLTGRDVKNRSLTPADFPGGALPQGPQGPQGPPGPVSVQRIAGPPASVPAGSSFPTASATCPAGTRLVGGGATTAPSNNFVLSRSFPSDDGVTWIATGINEGSFTGEVQAFALCAS